jgi:pyrophosphate--fructose-6-phosphate 1-phosphotransferase
MVAPQRSPLEIARLAYTPELSHDLHQALLHGWAPCHCSLPLEPSIAQAFPAISQKQAYQAQATVSASPPKRPLRCGVVFSGGPAAGGHNVLWGLLAALQQWHPDSRLIGFLAGPSGILENKTRELSPDVLRAYHNQGGFDCLGSGRTKIETPEQLDAALDTCQSLHLDGLVIIGGDDSNTNAAVLAERALARSQPLCVVGTPKTIDGDLRNPYQPISFGFDTATKVYSEAIGNIARDAVSSRKYTHFVKLMGRSASHVTLECALQTHPNLCFIGEEIQARRIALPQIVENIVDWFISRKASGKPYGVILVPEGLVEFLTDVGALLQALNRVLGQQQVQEETLAAALPAEQATLWNSLPAEVRGPLLAQRDPHGNVPLSAFETEKLLALLVAKRLNERGVEGFSPVLHFLGYEGRCALPTNFDASYCFALGWAAAAQVAHGLSGFLTSIVNPQDPCSSWRPMAIPLARLIHLEERKGKMKPVIAKYLVDLKGRSFLNLQKHRAEWAQNDSFRQPGPVQFFGERQLTWQPPLMLTDAFFEEDDA